MVLILAFLGVVNFAAAQVDDDDDDVSKIPQRPYGQILDSARWLSLEEKGTAQKELSRLYEENQIDVFLVTLSEQPPQGAAVYARKLGETWSKAPVWCVVFHVPGDPSGFHVEAGGVEMARQKIDQAVAEAVKRARRENTEKERVMAAWKECSEGLRFVHASAQRHNERVVEVKKGMRSSYAQDKKREKILIAAAGLALVLFVLISYGIIRLMRRSNFTFEFPDTSWRIRFKGPHSGGSGIVVNYRGKRLK